MDRLEEIRKRDAQEIEAADMWIHHYTACADRRWLLGEVERLQERIQHKLEEEAAYLDTIRQYAETRDQYAAEVEAQREELGRLIREQAVLKDEDNRLLGEVDRLVEEIETLKQWIKDAKCALNGER